MKRIALLAIAFCMLPVFAVKVEASEGADISVSASSDNISITASGFSGNVVIRGYKANEYPPGISHGISKENMSAGECIDTTSSGKTVTVPRYTSDGYDRLYERFAAVKDGIVISRYVYAKAPKAKNIRFAQKSIKGIFSENSSDTSYAEDLKANSTVINIDTASLPDTSGKSSFTKKVNGKTYHFNAGAVRSIDSLASAYARKGMNVTAVCVNWSLSRVYGYSEMKDARVSGFNTSENTGRDWFTATMEFLADRYSRSADTGLIQSYVIGNEIDTTGETYLCSDFNTYMEEYYRCLRLADTAVKKYASDACVIVPFTHYWAKSATEITGETNPSYKTTDIIRWLATKSKAEGDFDWGIAPHLYGSSLFESSYTGTDISSGLVTHSQDSPELTYTSFEQLADFLSDPSLKYDGKERNVYITEGGPSAGIDNDLARSEQAATLAFAYYKVSQYPFVKEFNEYRLFDNPKEANVVAAGLMTSEHEKRPSYEVYRHVDQADTFDVSVPYLKSLSIAGDTWKDTIEKSGTSWDPQKVTASGVTASPEPEPEPKVEKETATTQVAETPSVPAPETQPQPAVFPPAPAPVPAPEAPAKKPAQKAKSKPKKQVTKPKKKKVKNKKKISLSTSKVTMYVGEKRKIKLKNVTGKVTWKTSSKLVSLSGKGASVTVKAKRAGKAVMSARKDGKTYTAGITVKKKQKKAKKKSIIRRLSDLIRNLLKG